jgi:hypothetical protein
MYEMYLGIKDSECCANVSLMSLLIRYVLLES